ncbi:hypothetical protein O181_102564 [Austropuccinia psidii MF-1]|uniref:Reverse transcriptase Ty1/copia-type domain-containing protein n=1 Tax=Austropuccinia psidii MF-1 TaxID=1389203 RepID=A0A9Q3PIC8_9BASI|nr:hypothetical protein [Austropuccinia psidii MF-1]
MSVTLHLDTPSSYNGEIHSSHAQKWEEAIGSELKKMDSMEVWTEVPKRKESSLLGTRWVFTVKRDPDGIIMQYKACIAVQGHRQIKELNFDETFAPTPTFTSLECLFSTETAFGLPIQTFDVTATYLHSELAEDIYINPPPGLKLQIGSVLNLNKALYDLKQARRFWWQHLTLFLYQIMKTRAFICTRKGKIGLSCRCTLIMM